MSNCASDFAYANQEQGFAIVEDTCGTLKKPTAGSAIYTIAPGDPNQDQEFLPDQQIRAGASRRSPIPFRKLVGDMSLQTYVKPSGTLGTVPEHSVLFQGLMGTKTATPGVSVVYTLADQVDSFSYWLKKGPNVFAMRGCVVQGADFRVSGGELSTIDWKIQFMEKLWAGTAEANASVGIGVTMIQLVATGAQRFCAGMYVKVGSDDNSGAGFLIESVNYTLDQITLSSATLLNSGLNPVISPWLPTASAEVGTPQNGKIGFVTVGGQNTSILEATISFVNNIKFYDSEKNNSLTAERFGRPKTREISGNLQLFLLKAGLSYFYRSAYQISNALVIPVGNVAGKQMKISIPYAEYGTPKVSGDEEFIQDVPFNAIASASLNDEASITFD